MEPSLFKMLLFLTVICPSVSAAGGITDETVGATGCPGSRCVSGQGREVGKDRQPIIYDPNVTVIESSAPQTPPCHLPEIQRFVTSELERMAAMYARDEDLIRRQVVELQEAFADFTANVRNKRAPQSLSSKSPIIEVLPTDCTEVLTRGVAESGVYRVQPRDGGPAVEVYCDMDTEGGGWTVFQRRRDGSVDFYRNFSSYQNGFGDVEGEFWLGNDNIHRLTSQDESTLRVDLTDFDGSSAHATYSSFGISDASDYYRLTVGGFSGPAGDSLADHNDRRFTTFDVDNDDAFKRNCAEEFGGAWWYAACYKSHLNGRYVGDKYHEITWYAWKSNYDRLKGSEMKLRRNSLDISG